jgi:hypothetical protein
MFYSDEILDYVTTLHNHENYDDTDFFERINSYDRFVFEEIDIKTAKIIYS